MNEFRQALDAYLAGRTDLSAVERELHVGITRAPHLAAAHGAIVEANYRSGRLPGEVYLALIQAIRTLQTQQHAAVAPQAPTPGSAEPEKTQFRAPRPSTAQAAPPSDDAGADKTRFRVRSVPPPPAALASATAAPSPTAPPPSSAPAAPADRTRLGAARTAPPPEPSAPAVFWPTGPQTPSEPSWSPQTGTGSRTTGGRSTGSWTAVAATESEPLASGSVVKDRFVLEDELGRGGMGIVFKARDLRKEEAQDRNPHVAIKVLNEEFKRHPESLKALQRESRKAQNLAHPNVVTVYDFDRDGGNVFMVMELLEGESLDRVIRETDGTGVGLKEAMRMTRDICRAMAYAHEQGIVHSDFKPANAFLGREGTVKVFDFGIARAAKRSDGASGVTTLFDAGTLGALTPAYASCEMLDGLEPDTRDDVYAIACVCYELLTGRHPFDRLSAVQARDKRLTPKQPPGLSRAQWRALQRGLAFRREDRSASAIDFLKELQPPRRSPAVYVSAAAAGVVLLVVGGIFGVQQYERIREERLADALASTEAPRVEEALGRLAGLERAERTAVLRREVVRRGLVDYFRTRVAEVTNAQQGRYDYPGAKALVAQLEGLVTDSLQVRDLKDSIESRERDAIKRQRDRFDALLARGLLIDAQARENVGTVLGVIRQIDPKNDLLADKRLPGAFAEQTRKALEAGNTALAGSLVAAGLALEPKDTLLADLRDRVDRAANAERLAARRTTLERSLAALLTGRASLADLGARRAEIVELRSADPQSDVLARVQVVAHRAIAAEIAGLLEKREFDQAQERLAAHADIAAPAFVGTRREQIAASRSAHEGRLASLSQAIADAIRAGRLGAEVRGGAEQRLAELQRAGAPAERVSLERDRIAQTYVRLAAAARGRSDWAESRRWIAAGTALAPTAAIAAALTEATREADAGEQLARTQLDAAERRKLLAQREKEEGELRSQLAAGLGKPRLSIDEASRLRGIADKLASRGVADPVVAGANGEIQARLAREAASLRESGRLDQAIGLAERAATLYPDSQVLQSTIADLRAANAARSAEERNAQVVTIKKNIDALIGSPKAGAAWDADFKRHLRELSAYLPASDPYVSAANGRAAAAHLGEARKLRSAQRLSEAESMLERARSYAPQLPALAAETKLLAEARTKLASDAQTRNRLAQIDSLKQKFETNARAGEVADAQASLAELRANLPAGDPYLKNEAPGVLASVFIRLAAGAAKAGEFGKALSFIDKGREQIQGAPAELAAARERYVRYQALDRELTSKDALNVDASRRELAQLSKLDAREAPQIADRLARRLADRIRGTKNTELAASLSRSAAAIFPSNAAIAALQPGQSARPTLPAPVASTANRPAMSDSPPASGTAEPPAGATQSPPSSGSADPGTPPTQPAPGGGGSTRPAVQTNCSMSLAGHGKLSRAVCFDRFEGGRGPDLVVIPPSGATAKSFAIGRTEVSNAEYAAYCSRTGCAGPQAPPDQPVVGIALSDAQRYAEWLSQTTGASYRLPTDAEWTHAARATGEQDAASSINCVVELAGKKVRGNMLDAVRSGTPNAWGLYNPIGNAQEWTRSGGTVTARGGAFTDNVSQCSPDSARSHPGSADAVTGFRVLREMG